jgi:hypothetical protein
MSKFYVAFDLIPTGTYTVYSPFLHWQALILFYLSSGN